MADEVYKWNDATAWNWAANASTNVKSGTAGTNGNGWQVAGDVLGGILGGVFGNSSNGGYTNNTGVYQNPNLNQQGSVNPTMLILLGLFALLVFRK